MLKRSAAIVACLSVLFLAGCGQEKTDTASDKSSDAASSPTTDSSPTGSSPEAGGNTVTCDYVAGGGEAVRKVDLPDAEAPAEGTTTATIDTNQGEIGISLDAAKAPCTVASFMSLANQGFFHDTPCPRIGDQPGFGILQCGDPSGTGRGGPGYSFKDELGGDETYPAGTLAMANAGPDTNGSQFFLVFADSEFDPNYTVFGSIDDDGLKVLKAIAAQGNDNANPAGGGAPNKAVEIHYITFD